MQLSIINLFHFRWTIPIIAEIQRHKGVKYIFLHKRLKINKGVLSNTLQKLIEKNYIKKNPGYGHPLRPEYIMHENGIQTAMWCLEFYDKLLETNLSHLLKSKWNFPVILSFKNKKLRFSEIKVNLTGITSKALTIALKYLEQKSIIKREITADYPPTTYYHLTEKLKGILPNLEKLSLISENLEEKSK